uniref:Uncharacterized protein n=1 Tax=Phlebotomus papatasi TaxID=29031 RepID=A0A1B0GP64_PHLPP
MRNFAMIFSPDALCEVFTFQEEFCGRHQYSDQLVKLPYSVQPEDRQYLLQHGVAPLRSHVCTHRQAWVLDEVRGIRRSEEGVCDLRDVLLFPEINCLEDINIRYTVILEGFLEVVDVFHHFELSTRFVDLWYRSGLEFVHEAAEDCAILEDILIETASWEFGTQQGFNPFLSFLVLDGITLSGNLIAPHRDQSTLYSSTKVVPRLDREHKLILKYRLLYAFIDSKRKITDDLTSNNNKWTGSCNSLLQHHQQQQLGKSPTTGSSLGSGLQNHHHTSHHHAAVAAAALASPFSSLLSAGGSAGYLLDPLGSLNKSTTANHLF